MNIRIATLQDIPSINALANAIWPIAYKDVITQEQIAYMLEKMYDATSLEKQLQNGDIFFIISDDEKDLGFASITLNEENDKHTKLNKLYVLTNHHSKGLGRKLLDEVITYSKNQQQEALFLQVNRNNKAVDFYTNYGLEIWREDDFDIGNGFWMNDYIMGINF